MNVFHHAVFPSIITEVQCSFFDLIQQPLIDWIYEYQKNSDGVIVTNRGGWQSTDNFWQQKSFSNYLDYILNHSSSSISFYNLNLKLSNMWININKKGNYNLDHIHPNSLISGVFWIKTSKNCGDLNFESPNYYSESLLLDNNSAPKEKCYCITYKFTPIAGSIVLFPSHLRHNVEENESDEDRISIAFNLNI